MIKNRLLHNHKSDPPIYTPPAGHTRIRVERNIGEAICKKYAEKHFFGKIMLIFRSVC